MPWLTSHLSTALVIGAGVASNARAVGSSVLVLGQNLHARVLHALVERPFQTAVTYRRRH